MTEDFKMEAFRYLLEELDVESRAAFDQNLAKDPAARAELKVCADEIARFACEMALEEAVSPATQRAILGSVLAAMADEPRARSRHRPWSQLIWPLAAAVLLGLNVWQLSVRSMTDRPAIKPGSKAASGRSAAENRVAPIAIGQEKASSREAAAGGGEHAGSGKHDLNEELRRLEKLRSEFANLEQARDALKGEYDSLLRQLAQQTLIGKGVGRLTAMELVDAGSYARGERRGLVDLAKGLLTEPGIVAVTPIVPPAHGPGGELPETSPIPTPVPPSNPPTAGSSSGSSASVVPTEPPSSTTPEVPTVPSTETQSGAPTNDQPYAWSLYDENAGRGYLNLYNLPTTPEGQSLQLWIKQANSGTYQNVGVIPPHFYGGNGSLYYNLPEGTSQLPVEILVTQEPRDTPLVQPTGQIVLRGP